MSVWGHTQSSSRRAEFSSFNLKYLLLELDSDQQWRSTATCAAALGLPNLTDLNWKPKSNTWPSSQIRCNIKGPKKGKNPSYPRIQTAGVSHSSLLAVCVDLVVARGGFLCITEIICIFHSGYLDNRGIFQIVLNSYCCVTGWTYSSWQSTIMDMSLSDIIEMHGTITTYIKLYDAKCIGSPVNQYLFAK